MAQPRLKPGDTFVYTEEMNEAKKRTYFNDNAAILIGQNVQVDKIVNDNSNEARYEIWEGNTCYYMLIEVVDPFLPEEPSNPRTLDDVKEGDVLLDPQGEKRLVLGRVGRIVAISIYATESNQWGWYSVEELKIKGYKFADQPAERWKPQENEKFWFVNSSNEAIMSRFWKCWESEYELGNCFKTKEEAEKAASELKEFWRGRINNQK